MWWWGGGGLMARTLHPLPSPPPSLLSGGATRAGCCSVQGSDGGGEGSEPPSDARGAAGGCDLSVRSPVNCLIFYTRQRACERPSLTLREALYPTAEALVPDFAQDGLRPHAVCAPGAAPGEAARGYGLAPRDLIAPRVGRPLMAHAPPRVLPLRRRGAAPPSTGAPSSSTASCLRRRASQRTGACAALACPPRALPRAAHSPPRRRSLEYKFLRVVAVCLVVKTIEKGNREETERHMADYNRACTFAACRLMGRALSPPPPLPPFPVRKANIDAAEKAMWEEELALHTVDTGVAEAAVLRQREVDWKFRSDLTGHARAMMQQLYPFVATIKQAPATA